MLIRRIQPHGFGELVARVFVLAHFEQRVRQILMDGRAIGRQRNGLLESGNGLIVAFLPQGGVGLLQRSIGGVGILGDPGSECQRQDQDYTYHLFTYTDYRCSGMVGEVISTIRRWGVVQILWCF